MIRSIKCFITDLAHLLLPTKNMPNNRMQFGRDKQERLRQTWKAIVDKVEQILSLYGTSRCLNSINWSLYYFRLGMR